MIHIKDTEEGFDFWFTEGISEFDIERLIIELAKYPMRKAETMYIPYKINDRLNKNLYKYYADIQQIGVDQLDNIDD